MTPGRRGFAPKGLGGSTPPWRAVKELEAPVVELVPPDYQAEEQKASLSELKSTLPAPKRGGELAMSLKSARTVEERIKKRAYNIVNDAMCAADIDDDSNKPDSWSDRRYRVAKDARKGAKERPYYLEMASKIREGFARLDALRAEPADLNANVINVYVDQRSYPTKEVKE